MAYNWQKQGLISNRFHSQLPIPIKNKNGWTVLVSSRDESNHSQIMAVELDSKFIVQSELDRPLLTRGKSGEFDDLGVMGSWYEPRSEMVYYTGWGSSSLKPYRHSIGIASWKGGQLARAGIVIDSKEHNGICSSPCVIYENGLYRMWHISGNRCDWVDVDGTSCPTYGIAYAESSDGLHWHERQMTFSRKPREIFARPCVVKGTGGYHMWYSYMILENPKRYRIGYAFSADGLIWNRLDKLVGIQPSVIGWDSESVAFPYVFTANKVTTMLYSGNNFGASGFGYATATI